jgi:catechol 2,3-dioxygenase-like lactoylglutathione lyase family enzyme
MRGVTLFGAGLLAGGLLSQTGTAQDADARGLNHVGMVVADYPAAMEFYTKTMGFREAYTMRRPDGSPILTYLQLSRDTFVELIPAGPNQPAGQTHFGVEYGNLDAAVARIRQRGAGPGDVGLTPARARFSRLSGPGDIQLELMEFGPDSMQRKAMDGWKP